MLLLPAFNACVSVSSEMGFSPSLNQGRTYVLANGSRVGFFSIIVSFACSFLLSLQNGHEGKASAFQALSEGSSPAVFGDASSFSICSVRSLLEESL